MFAYYALCLVSLLGSLVCQGLWWWGMARARLVPHGRPLQWIGLLLAAAGCALAATYVVTGPQPAAFLLGLFSTAAFALVSIIIGVIGIAFVGPMRASRGWADTGLHLAGLNGRKRLTAKGLLPGLSDTDSARFDEVERILREQGFKVMFERTADGWHGHLIGPAGENLDRTDGFPSALEAAEALFARESDRGASLGPTATDRTSAST